MELNRSIRLKEYEAMLLAEFPRDTVEKLFILIDNHLVCTTCKKIMPLSDFPICKSNRNRLGRYTDCRSCARTKYDYMKVYNM